MKPCADTSDGWVCPVNAGQYLVCRCQPPQQGVADFGQFENTAAEGFARADKTLAINNNTQTESWPKPSHRLCRMAHGGQNLRHGVDRSYSDRFSRRTFYLRPPRLAAFFLKLMGPTGCFDVNDTQSLNQKDRLAAASPNVLRNMF